MPPNKKKQQPITTSGNLEREAAIAQLKSRYPGITRVRNPVEPVPVSACLRTPSIQLNIATNEGGLRPGAVMEWYGLEMTMKTHLALQECYFAQQRDPNKSVAYMDPETAVDLWVAEKQFGIDMGQFEDGMPKFDYYPEDDDDPTLEDYLNRIYNYAASGLYSFIVLDSVAACMSNWEADQDDITNAKAFGPGIIMSKSMKRIKRVAAKTGTRIWYINQLRTTSKQGPHGPITVDEPGGGKAIRYAATHRCKVSWSKKVGLDKPGEYPLLRVSVEKNKYGPPWQVFEIPVILGQGVDQYADLVLAAERYGFIKRSTSWYAYAETGQSLGQGLRATAEYFRNDPAEYETLYQRVLHAGLPKERLETPLIDHEDNE